MRGARANRAAPSGFATAGGTVELGLVGMLSMSSDVDAIADQIPQRLKGPPGYCVIRSLDLAGLDDYEAGQLVLRLAARLGTTLQQDMGGKLIHYVKGDADVPFEFHTDSAPAFAGSRPGIMVLAALRPAASGGVSLLADGQAVYRALARGDAQVFERLHRPFCFDRARHGVSKTWRAGFEDASASARVTRSPVFTVDDGGAITVRYSRCWIEMGHDLAGEPLDEFDVRALDHMDAALAQPDVQTSIVLGRGDILFVNNHTTLHSRTPFTDEPGRPGRTLVRVWVKQDPGTCQSG